MVAFELFPHIFYPCKHQWNAIKWQRPAISTPMTIKSSELSQKQRATKQCHTQIKLLLNNSNTKKKKQPLLNSNPTHTKSAEIHASPFRWMALECVIWRSANFFYLKSKFLMHRSIWIYEKKGFFFGMEPGSVVPLSPSQLGKTLERCDKKKKLSLCEREKCNLSSSIY